MRLNGSKKIAYCLEHTSHEHQKNSIALPVPRSPVSQSLIDPKHIVSFVPRLRKLELKEPTLLQEAKSKAAVCHKTNMQEHKRPREDGLPTFQNVCVCMCVCVCAHTCACVCLCVKTFVKYEVGLILTNQLSEPLVRIQYLSFT